MPTPGAGAWWPAGDTDMLLAHLDACGIDQCVVFPPFACQMDQDAVAANRWAWAEVKAHPDRLLAAGTFNPVAPNALELLHMFHAEGVRQAKIHPSIDRYDIADPRAAASYGLAADLGIVLDFHTGPHGTRLSMAKPEAFDNAAWDFPKLRMIFEHMGGRTYFEEFLAIVHNHHGRLMGGLTSVLDQGINRMWYLGPERLTEAVRISGAGRFVFGLDFPWNSLEKNRSDIAILQQLDISAEGKAQILGGTLRALHGI